MLHTHLLRALAAAAALGLSACASHDHAHDRAAGRPGPGMPGGMHGGTQGGMPGGMQGRQGMQGMPGMQGMHAGAPGGMMRGMAVASLTPTQGSAVRGLVMFHQHDTGVMVHARVSGLKPGAEHGFHVHETGSCASPDGNSAGGHFNPDGKPHGPQSAPHHAGDMPSLKADAAGNADQHFLLAGPTVTAGPASVVGRAVIVHAQPDDYATQPTGNAGGRIGCGVIAGY